MNKKYIGKVVIALVIALTMLLGACTPSENVATKTETVTVNQANTSVMTLANFVDIIARVRPSVVAISTEVSGYSLFGAYTQEGAGSGWIISADGLIVTNNHVVDGATTVTVTLEDGRTFSAKSIYTDSFSDLAVIKIDAQNLPTTKVGSSGSLRVGDWVVAIGNSLGLGISATKGIVSALGVTLPVSANEAIYGLIQTDAAINPGNSGGPLVNLAGEVIGINSAKIQEVGVEGMGYAISIVEATPILNQLIASGRVSRPDIGASLYTVDEYVAQRYGLPVSQGVLVTRVDKGGPSDSAGIKQGDVIVALENNTVASAQALVTALQSYKVGQKVQITLYHGNNKQTASVTLQDSSG
jgi:serine protease Do